jgi:ferredoxin--NADP+ reductase
MNTILKYKSLNDKVKLMVIDAPQIAKKAEPGQFIILRVDEYGERIPLTIADYDRNLGTVTIIFQVAGATTAMLAEKREGEYIADFAGPLGAASHLDGIKKAAVIGGGVGCAIAYPLAKKLHELGAEVDVIAGFRNKDIIILEDEFKKVADNLIIATDDGSNGTKGFVTDMLKAQIEKGKLA